MAIEIETAKDLARLEEILRSMGSALLAFSGGVNSTLLLAGGRETLRDKLVAVTACSPLYPAHVVGRARELAAVIQNMIEEILGEISHCVDTIIERVGNQEQGPPDDELVELMLVELMTTVFNFIERNKGMASVFLHEHVGIDNEMSILCYNFQEKLTDQFARLVEYGREIRYLRESDSRLTADFIVGGLIHLARAFGAGVGDTISTRSAASSWSCNSRALCAAKGRMKSKGVWA